MGDITKQIKFLIVGDSASAAKAFQSAGKDAVDAGKKIEGIGGVGKVAGLGVAAIGAGLLVAGAAAVKFGTDSVSTFQRVGGEVSSLSRITGMSVEDASRLRFQFKMTGVDAETGAKGIKAFEKNLVANSPALKSLGIDARDASGNLRPMAEILPQVADKFKSMPDGAEKSALAMKLFGKSGTDLIPFLNKGAAGLADMAAKSDQLGQTLSGPQLDAMKKAKAAQREFDASIEGLQIQIGANLLPVLTQMTNNLMGVLVPVLGKVAAFVEKNQNLFIDLGNALIWVWNNALMPLIKGFAQFENAIVQGLGNALIALGQLTGNKDMVAFGEEMNSASGEINDFVQSLEAIPSMKRVDVKAQQESKALDIVKDKLDAIDPVTVTATAKGNPAGAIQVKADMDKLIDETVTAKAIGDPQGATDVKAKMDALKDVYVTAVTKGDVTGAQAALDKLKAIAAYDGRTVSMSVVVHNSGTMLAVASGGIMAYAGAGVGMVRAYANGGTEDHVAQIASGGAMRLWAEPETGGESYIPLAASKRTRSLDIWAKTGRLLGVPGFGDGGFSGAAGVGGSVAGLADAIAAALARHLPSIDVRLKGAVDPIADVIYAEIMAGYQGGA